MSPNSVKTKRPQSAQLIETIIQTETMPSSSFIPYIEELRSPSSWKQLLFPFLTYTVLLVSTTTLATFTAELAFVSVVSPSLRRWPCSVEYFIQSRSNCRERPRPCRLIWWTVRGWIRGAHRRRRFCGVWVQFDGPVVGIVGRRVSDRREIGSVWNFMLILSRKLF